MLHSVAPAELGHFRQWRQDAYRGATLVWGLLLLCAYTMTLLRMPMSVSPQVCLLSTLHLLTCLVIMAAIKGSNKGLRTLISIQMVVRSFGYIGIGTGLVPLEFKSTVFADPGSKAEMPLAIFSFWAALLFDSIGLVHAAAPPLQLLLQFLSATICSSYGGDSLLLSALRALILHGLCGLIGKVLYWRDLKRYTAMQERQRKASEDQLQAKEPKHAGIGCKARVEMPEQREGGSQGVQANEEARCLEDAQQAFGPAPAHAAAQGLVAGADLLDSPPISTLDTRVDNLYDALQIRLSGPEGRARLERIQLLLHNTHNRPHYITHSAKHMVVLKVPGPKHPSDLPPTAIPSLSSLVYARCPSCRISSAAARAGCILVCLRLREELRGLGQGEQGDPRAMEQAMLDAAQKWLHDMQLTEQLPSSTPILLQVDGAVIKILHNASTGSWSMQFASPLEKAAPALKSSIRVTFPAARMPPPQPKQQQQQQQQQQQEGLQKGSSQPGGSTMTLHASVRWPVGIQLCGWKGDAAALASPASGEANGEDEQQQGVSGKEEGVQEMQVLASVDGYGYLPTAVELEPTAINTNTDLTAAVIKVHVSLPAGVVSSNCPFLLGLELWHQSTLLGSSSMALLPASMPEAATELQGLPWGTADAEDVADFIMDLGQWLSSNHASSPLSSGSVVANQQQRTPWEVGVSLLQQSVLWGLPAVSTLLVDSLMAMPSAPVNPFTQLAHAPAGGAEPALRSPEDGDIPVPDIGGLLHLSLLCPNSRDMLAAVLDWGKRWGSREPGFSWRWSERSAAGLIPLDILASLPRESQVLRLLLQDPVHGRVLLTAALQHARVKEEARAPSSFLAISSTSSQDPHGLLSVLPESNPSSFSSFTASSDVSEFVHPDAPLPFDPAEPPLSDQASDRLGLCSCHLRAAAATATAAVLRIWKLPGQLRQSLVQRALARGAHPSTDMASEADYRDWVNGQVAPLAQVWCTLHTMNVLVAIMRVPFKQVQAPLKEAYCLSLLLPAYVIGALWMRSPVLNSEVLLAATALSRFAVVSLIGVGWAHVPSATRIIISNHLEMGMEVLLMSTLEQVRMLWAIPLRALLFMAYGVLYQNAEDLTSPHPWVKSAVLNASSLLVTIAMDCRNRHLYSQRKQRLNVENSRNQAACCLLQASHLHPRGKGKAAVSTC